MAQDEIKDRILGWCSQASEIAVVQDREEPGAEVAVLLRLQRPEGLRLGVFKAPGEDRISVIHTIRFPAGSVTAGDASGSPMATPSLGEAVEHIVESRHGSLTGATRPTSDGHEITLSSVIYEDGLTKHSFLTSVHEVARVRRALDRMHTGDLTEVNPVFPVGATSGGEGVRPTAEAVVSAPVEAETPSLEDEPAPVEAAGVTSDTDEAVPSAASRVEPASEPEPAARVPAAEATPREDPTPRTAEPAATPAVEPRQSTPVGASASPAPDREAPGAGAAVSGLATGTSTPSAGLGSGGGAAAGTKQPSEWAARSAPAPQQSGPAAGAGQAAPAPATPAAAPSWVPSHRVPPAGMDAWALPDPTQRAIARIDGGVPIQVTETAGAWAHVLCSNGWTGWVDYRILVPATR